jgi:hypothetical protein
LILAMSAPLQRFPMVTEGWRLGADKFWIAQCFTPHPDLT